MRSPEDVLPGLPGWQDACWTELDGGLSNRTWLLERDGERAVLKIDDEPRGAPYNSRAEEARLQSLAARQGLANRVLFVDECVLLCEFAEGTVWRAQDLRDTDNLDGLADAVRQLHALPRTERSFDAAGAAKIYARRIVRQSDTFALCRDIIESHRPADDLCCCHNDLVAENIIATPALRFLDWEYACDNDPLFDLATIVEHHELDETRAHYLLDAYFDGDGERRLPRLQKQRRLYRALLWLWLASRADTTSAELDGVERRLTTSCS